MLFYLQYLLNFLEKRPESVGLSDEELQKLLIDVQVGKVCRASFKVVADCCTEHGQEQR